MFESVVSVSLHILDDDNCVMKHNFKKHVVVVSLNVKSIYMQMCERVCVSAKFQYYDKMLKNRHITYMQKAALAQPRKAHCMGANGLFSLIFPPFFVSLPVCNVSIQMWFWCNLISHHSEMARFPIQYRLRDYHFDLDKSKNTLGLYDFKSIFNFCFGSIWFDLDEAFFPLSFYILHLFMFYSANTWQYVFLSLFSVIWKN